MPVAEFEVIIDRTFSTTGRRFAKLDGARTAFRKSSANSSTPCARTIAAWPARFTLASFESAALLVSARMRAWTRFGSRSAARKATYPPH